MAITDQIRNVEVFLFALNCIYFQLILLRHKTKVHTKKIVTLAARAVFACAILLILAPKQTFWTISFSLFFWQHIGTRFYLILQ
jgi:hypothetical protein